jgi:nucleotide-binding universal stress UspA family protein
LPGIRTILHATDFSKASARALQEATKLAQEHRARLLIVHVIEPVPYAAGAEFDGAEIYARLEDMAQRNAQSSMEKLMARLKKSSFRAESLLLRGSPHEQIVKAAKNKKADMIVIGTHGRTGLSKLFMGSVAGKVVALASCPVLTVRGK